MDSWIASCKRLDSNQFLVVVTIEARLKIYDDVAEKFPRAQMPKRLPLDFLSGQSTVDIVNFSKIISSSVIKVGVTVIEQLRIFYEFFKISCVSVGIKNVRMKFFWFEMQGTSFAIASTPC